MLSQAPPFPPHCRLRDVGAARGREREAVCARKLKPAASPEESSMLRRLIIVTLLCASLSGCRRPSADVRPVPSYVGLEMRFVAV